ncbi:MAG: choice-of-anchor D domain-containing protein, partial [Calditrichaeota bacterium]
MTHDTYSSRVTRLNLAAGQTLINASDGTIISDGTQGSREINGNLDNQGLITIDHPLQIAGTSVNNAAAGIINGNANLTVAGATLQNAGTIDPGGSGKSSFGLIGSVNQPASGTLKVDMEGLVPGTDFDQLNVNGAAQLNGTLNINRLNAYEPALGDSFTVLTYGSRIDTFQTITGQDIGNGKYFYPNYHSDHLALFVGPPPVTPQFTLTASTGPNGSISPSGAIVVFQGDNQTFTMTPISGYEVADVLVDGVSVGAVSSYDFLNVTADHTISVTFQPQTFTITASAGAGGGISPSGAVQVVGGTDQTFTIAPDVGYHILDVQVDGVSQGALSSYVFNSVTANHTISATFEINTYTIVAQAGPNGTISPSGNIPITHGNSQIFTITPNANFEIADVLVDGVSVGAVSTYEFLNVTSGHTIQAIFVPITHTITASAGSGGLIQPSGTTTVNQGSDFTFNIIPNPGYSIADVLVDSGSVGAVSSYTFTNITTSHTISASFVQNTFTIIATAGLNGTITPSGSISVPGGSSQTFNITPDSGYHVADVLIDGGSIGAVTSYTFGNVSANHTIEASFAINTYTILAGAGSNGSITPSGSVVVNHGDNQSFSISPNVNYNIGDVLVDGVSQGAISSYDFLNVTANHSISAFFTPDNFSFATLSTGVTVNINNVYFVNTTTGYAVADDGLVLITTDGGQTWTQSYIGVAVSLKSVIVVNDTIWVAGANGHICYSIDGGGTWIPANPGGVQTFHSITFSGGFGWACGADGLIYFWNGTSWVQQVNVAGITFQGIYAIGNFVYAVGTGGVIYFWNGTSWAPLTTGITVDLYGVYFLDINFGYVVGANGVIYRTTDGGVTWVALNTGILVIIRNIIIGDANTAWAVCEGGIILQTTDGGNTWEQITPGCGCDLLGITFVGGQGYVVGSGGVAYNFQSTLVTGNPSFAVTPTSLDFGDVGVGYAKTLSVTVSNSGDAQLNVTASATNGNYVVNPLSASISAGGSLEFFITFNPTSAGTKSGSID